MDAGSLISEFGFPVVMSVGMGYFIYYVWAFISVYIKPELSKMHMALIKVIDQTRMLDNDMIRLDQKINTIIEIQNQQMDPFENANQRRKDAQQDKSIDANSVKIEKLKKGKKND